MFIYHLNELIKIKETKENKKISDTKLAEELGITRQTLAKLKDYHITKYVTTTEIIEKLLKYFECKCITELIEWISD